MVLPKALINKNKWIHFLVAQTILFNKNQHRAGPNCSAFANMQSVRAKLIFFLSPGIKLKSMTRDTNYSALNLLVSRLRRFVCFYKSSFIRKTARYYVLWNSLFWFFSAIELMNNKHSLLLSLSILYLTLFCVFDTMNYKQINWRLE